LEVAGRTVIAVVNSGFGMEIIEEKRGQKKYEQEKKI